MHYDAQVYRPPAEAANLLLQVTSGCSHNTCRFCNMYDKTPFRVSPLEEVRADLIEASQFYQGKRIYLLNGDPFALSAKHLLDLCALIHTHLPSVERISMYASVANIQDKSDEDLHALRAAGVNYLYIGLETGYDPVLQAINKGTTAADALFELKRLEAANIRYVVMLMTGVAGQGLERENALASAELLGQLRPRGVSHLSLVLMPGTPMYADKLAGRFQEADEISRLLEMKVFLENLHIETFYFAQHVSNSLPMKGRLPQEQASLLASIETVLAREDEESISRRFNRNRRGI